MVLKCYGDFTLTKTSTPGTSLKHLETARSRRWRSALPLETQPGAGLPERSKAGAGNGESFVVAFINHFQ
jgi:hypothetical protein